jgi:hypothetical protein
MLDLSINLVKRVETYFRFRSSDQHAKDEIKLAASDPNIFNSIISAFVGKMNKNSMKRRYSGQAAVMMPGYNFAQMFHFKSDSGYIDLTSHDIAKEAYNFRGVNLYKIEPTTSEDDNNKDTTYTLPKTSKSITLHSYGNTFTLDVSNMEGDKVELSELERL